MSTPYHATYRPPFPALQMTLRGETGQRGPLSALIDTGADVTLVSAAWLEEIGAVESGWALLRSHFGERQQVQKFLVDLQFAPTLIPGLYVVADERGSEIILGRDALNRLPLFLDGPHQQTDLLSDTTAQRLRVQRQTTS
jgi:hypothetical protein